MNFEFNLRDFMKHKVLDGFILDISQNPLIKEKCFWPLVSSGLLFYRCISRKIYIFVSL